ncbi:MAG: hypothetical protein A3I12_02605 [Gammaproteobacteria bacterium RIFCSPLOWO2_02_FULL_38_11]|nr:MAG: hypothetical protein A2W47_00130 [Gammaproteobacteria bacterium RIFCSPHIGHO2_12_38_15]OGT69485.1 MAG: hypothetical protein A3I12_02605 [Gammaproteobacteria bacterium RIFCSPLOWO2_02_FULL_38_11]OGT76917.1 MAG: hypothetical protein A3G71_05830 [Gammaproteobacteria bacterium RIFCSPLOWO2_12_FULL_38_14]
MFSRNINDQQFPIQWNIKQNTSATLTDACAWFSELKTELYSTLNTSGALLIKGLTCINNAETFQKLLISTSMQLRDYVGGTSPREQVYGKIMTATYTPPNWSIPLHQEMAYTHNPPDRIAFFCHSSNCIGGESTLGNMQNFTMGLPAQIINKFQSSGLQLRRSLPSKKTLEKKPGIKKPWEEVFNTCDKTEVDKIAKKKGWKTEWIDDTVLQLWQETLPALKTHAILKKEIWFNQAHFFPPISLMTWAKHDQRQEDYEHLEYARKHYPHMLDMVFFGNGEPVTDEEALYLFQTLKQHEIHLKLDPTDILILDNTLVAHGRTAFSGERNICVALINAPEFK